MKQKLVMTGRLAVLKPSSGRFAFYLFLIFLLTSLAWVTACRRDKSETLKRAAEAWDAGDYATAAEAYEHFLQEQPAGESSAEARFQLANVYNLNLRRYDAARVHYREFLNQAPSHPSALLARERLADVLTETGRIFDAIAEYENLNPPDRQERRRLRLRIADLYYDQQNYSQALTEYEKVVDAAHYDDLTEQALQRQASILHRARGLYKQALPVYQRLAEESGDEKVRLRALYGIADCKAESLAIDEAVQTLRSIADPDEQPYINKRIAELEARKKEAAQARNAIK